MSDGIYARHSPYLDRYVQVGLASGRVISVSFSEEPDPDAGTEHDLLDRIEAYLEGVEDDFTDVTVAFTVGGDDRGVLETTREVPYGEDVTVAALARMTPGLDAEADEETVREALAANPAPLLVPDHRVRDGPSAAPPAVVQKLRQVENL
ncbi:MAG: methylated-DNA--[protein]-cysteine S-methyltransferase [Halobacteriaceae archaeon]